jgi:hypothetical protein
VAGTLHGTAANLDIAAGDDIQVRVTTAGGETLDGTSAFLEILPDPVSL